MVKPTSKIRLGVIAVFSIILISLMITCVSAARNIQWVKLNNDSQVTVEPSDSITASVRVQVTNPSEWGSTKYQIEGQSAECINHADHNSVTYTEPFSITAPSSAGTYDFQVWVYNIDDCKLTWIGGKSYGGKSYGGETETLTDGIIVEEACTPTTWYEDKDGDGYSTGNSLIQCDQPTDYYLEEDLTSIAGDCNDNNPDSWQVVVGYQDNDGDGWTVADTGLAFCIGFDLPAGYIGTQNDNDCNDEAYSETNDCVAPVITIENPTVYMLLNSGQYDHAWDMTAIDDVDGDLLNPEFKVVVGGDDIGLVTQLGTYLVTYNVQDSSGNPAEEVTRTVIVDKYEGSSENLEIDFINLPTGFFDLSVTESNKSPENISPSDLGFSIGGKFFEIISNLSNGNFTATLTFKYADVNSDGLIDKEEGDETPDINENDLEIYYYDGTEWVVIPITSRDTGANTITVTVDHFTWFGLLYSIPATTTTTTSGGGGPIYCTTQWTCTAWSTCSAAGIQTRACSYPAGFCAPTSTKPVESQTCTPEIAEPVTETTEEETTRPGILGAVIGGGTASMIGIILVIVLVALLILTRVAKKKKAKKEKKK